MDESRSLEPDRGPDVPKPPTAETIFGSDLNETHVGRQVVRRAGDHDQVGRIHMVLPQLALTLAIIDWSPTPDVPGTLEHSAFHRGSRTIDLIIDEAEVE